MDNEPDAFLTRHRPRAIEHVVWSPNRRFHLDAYLTDDAPPLYLVTSARAVVIRDGCVLVMQDRDGTRHILPGGRLEAGESPETAVRREVSEESGWTLGQVEPLGFMHFRYLDQKPSDYPYSSFMQMVHVATALNHTSDHVIEDDLVIGSELVPVAEVRHLPLTARERLFLDAVMNRG